MFARFRQIFSSQNKDLRKRILFTFFVLFIFKLGTTIIAPSIDKEALGTSSLDFLQILNVMGGGALQEFSIFALGVLPYVNASILVSLLQMDIIPYFSELGKQGETGRAKLNQITRYLGIALAFVQGFLISRAFISNGTILNHLFTALILTAGTCLVIWMADRITEKGVGNGISLIIMAGIVATLPNMFVSLWSELVVGSTTQAIAFGITKFLLFVLLYLAILIGVVYIEITERRIPIQYANKSTSMYGKQQSYIPFKLNSTGVMPVIFASMVMAIPSIVGALVKSASVKIFINKWLVTNSVTGFIIYMVCIFAFSYFYTIIQIKPEKLAEDLGKSGGYVPGIRPGKDTENYLKKVLKRITTVGALSLAVLAGLPIIFGSISNLSTNISIGGTGLLIVVGVALETYKQLDGELLTRSFAKKGRIK